MYLAGDIGGTKTHLALYKEKGNYTPFREKIYLSQNYATLEEIIEDFCASNEKIGGVCFGVAGPIKEGKCQITNLPWEIDLSKQASILQKAKAVLLNDLEATAYGIHTLREDQFFVLNEGEKVPGNQALIAAGTGLGEAGLFLQKGFHLPIPSEGGHSDFAPQNEQQLRLLQFLQKKFGHVSNERVLSGPGFLELYSFFVEVEKEEKDEEVEKAGENGARVITEKGLSHSGVICEKVLSLFTSIYGAESGNLALKFLSLGGFYIGGGIAPKILESLKTGVFMEAFTSKGRFKKLLKGMPVKIILDENTGLRGAAFMAMQG